MQGVRGEASLGLQRRTTFRIRPDRCAIRAHLEGRPPAEVLIRF